ncbi:aryl-alcohol oxidase-like protein [Crucibulum laeve]|uniref:pyranose dehydrogenase (acceptor) n=1 Tax=Crucibulum laeve TaxID=68775 RepID=A0A5C3LYE2_9AGAR|nr:aryl-alcohol oxidase-like protein [Crucibulum laeve]
MMFFKFPQPGLLQYSFLLLLNACLIQALVYTNPNLIKPEYDFVIVGAGAAGNVMANRLTESGKFNVLLIEAGPSNQGLLPSIVPFLAPSIQAIPYAIWNYTTIPQPALDNRTLAYVRGKLLGGSSSINFLTFTRGSDDDFDRWARLTEEPEWSWKNLRQYYLKSEKLVPPADAHDTTHQCNPSFHGNGPIEVSVPTFATDIDGRVISASKELGEEFKFNLDVQSGDMVGISVAQSTIGSTSKRSSSATGYLNSIFQRKNLDILIQTQVTKLLPSNSNSKIPSFQTVQFAQNSTGKIYHTHAKKEVILSAGAINTPQILMLSGIGDRAALTKKGIKPLVDLPDVGQHLQDHPLLLNYFRVNTKNTFDTILRDPHATVNALNQWNTTGEGQFADSLTNSIGFIRLDNSFWNGKVDPSAGPKSGHFEMIFIDGFAALETPAPNTGNFITVNTAVLNPLSRGSVTLASVDPFVFPVIDPGFFTAPLDVSTMVEAVKAVRKFFTASIWNGYVTSRFGTMGDASTDAEIASAARQSVVTIWHPASTAMMSPEHAKWGVVTPKLLVKGTSGLRIVDTSIFPIIPAAHTVGPVYIVAERAADFVKEKWC